MSKPPPGIAGLPSAAADPSTPLGRPDVGAFEARNPPTPGIASSAPANANVGRGERFRELLRTPVVAVAVPVAVLLAGGLGLLLQNLWVLAAGPLVASGIVLAVVLAIADKRSAEAFFESYAARHGFSHREKGELVPLTPLLGAGDHRFFTHVMEGALHADRPDRRGTLSHYSFDVPKQGADGDTTWERHPYTICLVELQPPHEDFSRILLNLRSDDLSTSPGFIALSACVANGMSVSDFAKGSAAAQALGPGALAKATVAAIRQIKVGDLAKATGGAFLGREKLAGGYTRVTEDPELQVESTAFNKRYRLKANAEHENAVRQLFSPTFIVWLAEHPLKPAFEYVFGTLVVYIANHAEDAGKLDWLLEATHEIARRIERELAESEALRAPSYLAPAPATAAVPAHPSPPAGPVESSDSPRPAGSERSGSIGPPS